jgi:hypothetical protein
MRWMPAALLLLLAAALPARAPAAETPGWVQAVEFPFENFPRPLWERELVWLRNMGIRIVAFRAAASVPEFQEQVRLLRAVGLRGWIRGAPDPAIREILTLQLARHGGPVGFVDAPGVAGAETPPAPVTVVSAAAAGALARSRLALESGRGSLLWVDVEDTLQPAYRRGAVSFSGEERPAADIVRRSAALGNGWAAVLGTLERLRRTPGIPGEKKLPAEVLAAQLAARGTDGASVVSIVNRGAQAFARPVRIYDRVLRRWLVLPRVEVPAGGAVWLPAGVPLAYGGLCRDCTGFARRDRIVYATAELQSVEFENGILAMEFSAPRPAEAVLELSAQPTGPYLAAGTPEQFDWDRKTMRARLPIPAGKGRGNRVRVGLAIGPVEQTGFFTGPSRLILGGKNLVSTVFSSPALRARSRLLVPPGFEAAAKPKSPNEVDYELTLAPGALHGQFFELALEADGVRLGRTRLQAFRPVSPRLASAVALHFGPTALEVDPPLVAMDPRAPRNVELILRNNAPSIGTFTVEFSGPGLEFSPARVEVAVGAVSERTVASRVFFREGTSGIYEARARVAGAAAMEMPFRVAAIRRGEAIAYSMDFDGDGSPEWILENHAVRAVISARGGGRWLEFVWKDMAANVLPETGVFPGSGPVDIRGINAGREARIEVTGAGWRRKFTVRGEGAALEVGQDTPLPPEILAGSRAGGVQFLVNRPAANRAVYTLAPLPPEK